jgi:hypothetical protein
LLATGWLAVLTIYGDAMATRRASQTAIRHSDDGEPAGGQGDGAADHTGQEFGRPVVQPNGQDQRLVPVIPLTLRSPNRAARSVSIVRQNPVSP